MAQLMQHQHLPNFSVCQTGSQPKNMLLVGLRPNVTCKEYERLRRQSVSTALYKPDKERPTRNVRTKQRKSVHFADTKGLPLTSTIFFAKAGKDEPPSTDKNTIVNSEGDQHAKLLNFKSHKLLASHLECLRKNNVSLKKVLCNKSGIYGRVEIKNFAFPEEVFVQYTWDAWKKSEEKSAICVPDSTTAETVTYFFHIASPRSSGKRSVQFSIRCKLNGVFFYDDNEGDNYQVLFFASQE